MPSDASRLFQLARDLLAEQRDLEARLALGAGLTALSQGTGITPVIVGGTAVDFYAAKTTPSGLTPSRELSASQDVDVIVVGVYAGASRLRQLLSKAPDFYRDNEKIPIQGTRKWWLKGAPMLVEVLGGELAGDPERVVRIEIGDGEATLWGPEDTIWHYAQASLALKDRYQWERARVLSKAQETLDWPYMEGLVSPIEPHALFEALGAADSFEQMLERVDAAKPSSRTTRTSSAARTSSPSGPRPK